MSPNDAEHIEADHIEAEQRPAQRDEAGSKPVEEKAPGGEADKKKRSIFKKTWVRILLLVLVVVALAGAAVWGYNWWTAGRFIESTNDAYVQADKVTVSARVAGAIEKVLVTDNQRVTAGQPLAQIDDRDPRARMEQAKAQSDQARAGIDQATAQISQQDAKIAEAQAQLAGSQVQLQFANRQMARYAPLARSGAETGERLDQLRQNRDQAQAQSAQNAAAVLSAKRQIAMLQAQIGQYQAQIQGGEAQIRRAQVDLDASTVRASIDGRVGDKTVQVGQYVQTGTRLMTVVPVASLYIIANFKETQVGQMRIGQKVTITVDAVPDKKLHGSVESFAPGTGAQFALIPPSNATGNFTKIVQRIGVRIRFDADDDARQVLVPGLSVTVSVDTKGADAQANGKGPSQ